MAKNKKATAKQSLKRRSKKMLCRRLDTMRRGNMYGGAYEAVSVYDHMIPNVLSGVLTLAIL